MTAKVSLVNVGNELWTYLCKQIPPPVALSNFTNEQQLSVALKTGKLDADIIVLGHHLSNPLKVSKWIRTISPETRIFLLRKPGDFEAMQKIFADSPELGEGIELSSTADIKKLPPSLIIANSKPANDTNIRNQDEQLLPTLTKKASAIQADDISIIDDLLNNSSLGLVLLNKNYTITHLNDYFCKLLNLTKEDCLNKPIGILLGNNEQSAIQQLVRNESSLETCKPRIITIITDDHRTLHLQCTISLNDAFNKSSGIALVLQDQSDRVQTEEFLNLEQARNRATLDLLTEGVIITDNTLCIRHMNPVAENLLGLASYEAAGSNAEEVIRLIDSTKRERVVLPGLDCIRDNQTVELTENLLLIDKRNHEHSVVITVAPRILEDNEAQGLVIIIRDRTENNRLNNEILHHASHDSLTGLLNRQEFEHQLEKSTISAAEHNVQHILCYIDVNQFKIINTQAGHTAGDAILKDVAQFLQAKIRGIDYIGRLGGDEFALLLINCSMESAKRTAQTLVNEFQKYRFDWNNQTFELGLCIGIVAVNNDSPGPAQMITRAELACFSAKDKGRNQIHSYQVDDDELTRKQAEILRAAGITDALEENRFKLYCQPIVSLAVGGHASQHYELLLRLTDAQDNIIMPESFIPAAERYGLMPNVDRWVIHTALHNYNDAFGENSGVHIAINLSGNSLNDDRLLGYIKAEILSSQINPEKICFEITETAAINNLSQARILITELKTLGCCFALDDFGSGLSSFTYLKNLPVDYLKIDGSFVTDMAIDTIDYAMVEAINQLGHVMGIGTIAECAESEEVVDQLRKLGVDFAQGYAMGSPIPLDGMKSIH